MQSMGSKIKCLRKVRGATQEEMARRLNVTYQAVSKWENGVAMPDISLIPGIAAFLRVTTDELFGYQLHVMTDKERLISMMHRNGILYRESGPGKNGMQSRIYVDSERFHTTALISKLGEVFADRIRNENFRFDALGGLAYHGIVLASAAAVALYNKYGISTCFFHDRKIPDFRGRTLHGYTPKDGERILLVDDALRSGKSLREHITRLRRVADVQIAGVLVIYLEDRNDGAKMLEEEYGAPVCSLITGSDVQAAIQEGVITL